MSRVIMLRVEAPAKPPVGEHCNGCGVCCASEPCPVGALLSRRLHGACAALEFSEDTGRYRCGFVTDTSSWMPRALRPVAPWVSRLALRFIAAGKGCDSDVEAEKA